MVFYKTDARNAIYDIPVTHYVPKYIDIAHTRSMDRFGIYFNNVLVATGETSPTGELPGAYALAFRLLGLNIEVHVIRDLGDKDPMPPHFGELDILSPADLSGDEPGLADSPV